MDEETQIPNADELEWLETNNFLPDYEEEEDFSGNADEDGFPVNEDEIGGHDGVLPIFTALPHPEECQILRKRIRPEESNSENLGEMVLEEQNVRKRIALDILDKEQDEDWLRYSPPPPEATDVHIASESDHLMSEVRVEEKTLSKFAVDIEGDCMPVTGQCGDRVYAKLQLKTIAGEDRKKLRIKNPKDGLLSEPISALISKLDCEAFAKGFEENENSTCHQDDPVVPITSEKLWVEKYAPYSFTELLSDEQTNREVLTWLKQWDSCVFGSQIRSTNDDVLSDLRRHSSNVQHQKSSDRKTFLGNDKGASFSLQYMKSSNALNIKSEDSNVVLKSCIKKDMVDHPPEHKVLLLCGPPGLGKTTLAHVAAKHCGYRVVEINASDDRSSSALESKILDAVQMNSVTSDSKPKCLVIDEIDGALEGKGAVEVILKMVAADNKANSEKGNAIKQPLSEKPSSKRGKKSASLLRPIICICNDLYAPALRPMRQIAKVHMFVQPTINRVVNRLKYICKKEGLKTNSIALAALAEYTECDIRSCLNTLQFLNRKKETLNILEVGSQVIGQKDISRSCIDIWKKIFQKTKSKREKRLSRTLNGQDDFEFMYSLLSSRGDYDLIMDGIHENYVKLSYIDPMMTKIVRCLDALGISDSLHQYVMRTQKMALHAYQPPIAITISRLIALVEKPNIEWPKSLQRFRAMNIERKDLFKLWQSKISPTISRHLSSEYFVKDFISLFLRILAPPTLRPVAAHLFSEREKDDVDQLVDTMFSYFITYKNSKPENSRGPHNHVTVNDAPILILEPPIDDFTNFKDSQPTNFGFSPAMKQILLHEVERHRIRSSNLIDPHDTQASTTANSAMSHKITPKPASAGGSGEPGLTFPKRQKENENKHSNSKINKHVSSASFFDRFRQGGSIDSKSKAGNMQKAATAERDSRPFLFKFNEGFTNAVKRSVKVRELLI